MRCFLFFCRMFFMGTPMILIAQNNPAWPDDACRHPVSNYQHFEFDSNQLRLYYFQTPRVSVYRAFDGHGQFLTEKICAVDSMPRFEIVNDSILRAHNALDSLIDEQKLPGNYYSHKNFIQDGNPLYWADRVAFMDSCFYFLWRQQPVNASWPGEIYILKTNLQFQQIGPKIQVTSFYNYLNIDFFGRLNDHVLGLNMYSEAAMGNKTTAAIAYDKDLGILLQETGSATSSSPVVPTYLQKLPNQRFLLQKGNSVNGSQNFTKVYGWKDNGLYLLQERYWSFTPGTQRMVNQYRSWSDEGTWVTGKSDDVYPDNSAYVWYDQSSPAYNVEVLKCQNQSAPTDTTYMSIYSLLNCHGMAYVDSNYLLIGYFGSDYQIIDVGCSQPPPVSTVSAIGLADDIQMYPTVFQNQIQVRNAPENSRFLLFDLLGRKWFETQVNGIVVETGQVPNGAYLGVLLSAHGEVLTSARLLKQ